MKTAREDIVFQALLLIHISVACLLSAVSGQSGSSSSVVVAGYNVSAPAGSRVVLQCVSGRMVWTRDRVRDRQRVVHWDLYRASPDYARERMLDMFSAGDQRIYNSYNQGRVSLSPTAFMDGNFSLVIKDVTMNDRGLYSCNLQHLYCHLYETVRVQLNVTKSRRKEQRFWDGQKAVYVVLLGSTVVLPCINRRNVWTDWSDEEEDQQVVHWDRQSPGVSHDRADRLVDLYASGEQRSYGPLFLQRKMNISNQAFSEGDFSLAISDLQPTDRGMYSCHLHHHYCGLHERREFQVTVEPPMIQTTLPAKALPSEDKDTTKAESPRVINVILPDQRHHFLLPLGYVLTSFLLLAFIILIIILITRRHKTKEFYPHASMRSSRSQSSSEEFEMDVAEGNVCSREERRFDYKNNLLKENHMNTQPKVIDLDKEMQKFSK
ncbi:matrix remodeling-associated protein 8-like isoform X1 [Micropterus dolomieu]|uniref:matrix remodeling-associated protein 8-like isoform X1 n=2 Tax=Micropterus dolomieu TaxID=147949 RepID=UPI001E8E8D5A|nr:matrix remodeling-associated protein 8-like isoform X1 [Micropterus dolomieu]XP_045931629.1 matrix remodeling-associated protein 8-like isoform X1 [Micropterus dolomieu]